MTGLMLARPDDPETALEGELQSAFNVRSTEIAGWSLLPVPRSLPLNDLQCAVAKILSRPILLFLSVPRFTEHATRKAAFKQHVPKDCLCKLELSSLYQNASRNLTELHALKMGYSQIQELSYATKVPVTVRQGQRLVSLSLIGSSTFSSIWYNTVG